LQIEGFLKTVIEGDIRMVRNSEISRTVSKNDIILKTSKQQQSRFDGYSDIFERASPHVQGGFEPEWAYRSSVN
jgi:hypothetical protein